MEPWLRALKQRRLKPNTEQFAFLESLAQRLHTEAQNELDDSVREAMEEPMFDLIHGIPGAGKSLLISWVRELFEEVMQWQHGVQFVCLGFQNAMAAHINGSTVHHWSGIPVGETDGASTTRDNNKLSARCQCLRFILIDEISMIAAQLFGQLELVVRKVIRKRSIYKKRPNGSERPFGGVNVLMFGDWWQIKPVSGTALYANPVTAPSEVARHGVKLFWGEQPNAVHK